MLMAILVPPPEQSELGGSREGVLEGSESGTASFQTFPEYKTDAGVFVPGSPKFGVNT